jgi:hypothetical protein
LVLWRIVVVKFEAEGKIFESLEQFIPTVKGQNFFLTERVFFTYSRRFLISTLDSRINVGQEINIGKFTNKNKRRALDIHRA